MLCLKPNPNSTLIELTDPTESGIVKLIVTSVLNVDNELNPTWTTTKRVHIFCFFWGGIFFCFAVWGTFPCYLLHFGARTCTLLNFGTKILPFALFIDFSIVLAGFSMVFIDLPNVFIYFSIVFIEFSMVSIVFLWFRSIFPCITCTW